MRGLVDEINLLEPEMQALSDEGLRSQTAQFREQVQTAVATVGRRDSRPARQDWTASQDEDERRPCARKWPSSRIRQDGNEREVLDDILPRAFAAVREASVRTIGQRHFDVQLIGGMVLHRNTSPK